MGIIKEFKDFAMRGNVMDMAVGIIIGGAFGSIVKSLVSDVVMPVIAKMTGGVSFIEKKVSLGDAAVIEGGKEVTKELFLYYGKFLQASFDFLIVAFAIFMMIKCLLVFLLINLNIIY